MLAGHCGCEQSGQEGCSDGWGAPQGGQDQEEGTGEIEEKPASERVKTSAIPV